jgi:hypothetical protein
MKSMKKTMTVCLLAVVLSPVISGAAEVAPAGAAAEPAKATFNLKFPGGTLGSLLGLLEEQSGRKPNVLCAADVTELSIPPLDLLSVQTENVLAALREVLADREPLVLGRMGNIYTLERRPIATASRVYYVGHLLKRFKVQDITTAIQTAWEMSGSPVKPELKYHQETRLLIVRADGVQQATIKNVLEELGLALKPAMQGSSDSEPKSGPDGSASH